MNGIFLEISKTDWYKLVELILKKWPSVAIAMIEIVRLN